IRPGAQSEASSHGGRRRRGADVGGGRCRRDCKRVGRLILRSIATAHCSLQSAIRCIVQVLGRPPRKIFQSAVGRMTATILITGFGPFPGAPFNPTEPLALELAPRRHPAFANVRRVAHVFRVSYEAVDRERPALIAREKPQAFVMFGLAGRTKHVRIETRARNVLTRVVPDADGQIPLTAAIVPGAPMALSLRAPTHRLLMAARATGVPAALSHNAGSYLCNYLCCRARPRRRAASHRVHPRPPGAPRAGPLPPAGIDARRPHRGRRGDRARGARRRALTGTHKFAHSRPRFRGGELQPASRRQEFAFVKRCLLLMCRYAASPLCRRGGTRHISVPKPGLIRNPCAPPFEQCWSEFSSSSFFPSRSTRRSTPARTVQGFAATRTGRASECCRRRTPTAMHDSSCSPAAPAAGRAFSPSTAGSCSSPRTPPAGAATTWSAGASRYAPTVGRRTDAGSAIPRVCSSTYADPRRRRSFQRSRR